MPAEKDDQVLNVQEQADGTVLVSDLDGSEDRLDPSHVAGDGDDRHEAGSDQRAGDDGDDRGQRDGLDHVDNASLTDPEREAIRERRRQERANKKQAARQREDTLKHELAQRDRVIDEMRERLLQVEQRNVAADVAQLDTAITRAQNATAYFKGVIEEATNKKDGATVADATQKLMQAQREAERLAEAKRTFVGAAQSRPPALDQNVKVNAERWVQRNSWYDPSGSDEDSAIVLAIDRRLASEGFDPRQEAYWTELDKRVARYLPHKAQGSEYSGGTGAPQGRPARTPVAGSGREGGAAGARQSGSTYQLSAARVQALKDAGTWDDPKARSDAIRRYREYDRLHQQRG